MKVTKNKQHLISVVALGLLLLLAMPRTAFGQCRRARIGDRQWNSRQWSNRQWNNRRGITAANGQVCKSSRRTRRTLGWQRPAALTVIIGSGIVIAMIGRGGIDFIVAISTTIAGTVSVGSFAETIGDELGWRMSH